ncbi:DNA topoisomerase IV subunit A [Taylorella equigenitalis]|uniref:DNA topoisomerase 4 subunit A n=2 Tax=Taylorella equigenitalis TaxID=29575 RepID=A0A654KI74_TAYEM|nr:DNA topoisomerase IV subunit A [Taylorella equigenitalis]ADU92147.1 Topoisomerase IV subunit A [Taylorella equigenitalis MCE9]ASY37660.1 DNA topoisomerase IV subunit A [Taylorella equigenitalis]ASY40647.1 DNA topoisomerase IV subunit A [Taylorella equigenitalis]ASY42082.1 DNA topoisomerase IV subunit A [Taylorella equigenitalis]KGK33232.1 DNA topoisomerase IV subunit A [Taylorella equigenitalis]
MEDTELELDFESNSQESVDLGTYASKAYLDYAFSVVKGRALPDVGDGQKPVQRRILYAMDRMGLRAGVKPVKSARVVGDVLGKYHPHGDQAAYDAMVRMAQDFSLRYPLIDGQGNFGSRDGDGAAAMRYTEARLSPIAELLLDELGEKTVEFIPNYDGQELEPAMLPARLPFLLLNGASGIAVGMATEIPSHNLGEVANACIAIIKNPNISSDELFDILPGPDYHSGAQIISQPEVLKQIYETGKGTVKVRARWEFEELARGQWQMVVTELPPNTSCQKVLEEIEELTNPKVKPGKKSLNSEQQNTKSMMLGLLDAVRDESGREDSVRLVFEPKTSRIDREEFVNALLTHTSMEGNSSINLVCIGIDGKPRQRNLKEILIEWVQFRTETVLSRTKYRLERVLDRIHVLEGREIVLLNVDEVISTIRNSDEPKPALIEKFNLSDRQAEDILEMKLRQLAKLEGIKIQQELEDKRLEQKKLENLLNSNSSLKKQIIKEIESDAKKYADARRTLIKHAEKATLEVKVVDEPVTVIISDKGWVRARQGHGVEESALNFKSGDSLYGTFEVRTVDNLIGIGSNGRVYTVPVSSLPSARGDGQPYSAMIDLESKTQISHYVCAKEDSVWLLMQDNGLGFVTTFKDMVSRIKAGKSFISMEEGANLLRPIPVGSSARYIGMLSKNDRFLIVPIQDIKHLNSGGRGTILMGLDPKDKISQVVTVTESGIQATGIYRNKQVEELIALGDLHEYIGKRARKGKTLKLKLKQATLLPLD